MPLTQDLDDLAEYTQSLKTGKMLVRHCDACDRSHHYPRTYCPLCGSDQTRWIEGSGRGTIYSFTIWRRRSGATVPAFVTLAEGPTLLASIVTDDLERVSIGAQVELIQSPEDEILPQFQLSGEVA